MKLAKIYTYTIIRSSTKDFQDQVPYCSAILEIEGQPKFAALLKGYQDGMEVQIGQEVHGVSEENGEVVYSL